MLRQCRALASLLKFVGLHSRKIVSRLFRILVVSPAAFVTARQVVSLARALLLEQLSAQMPRAMIIPLLLPWLLLNRVSRARSVPMALLGRQQGVIMVIPQLVPAAKKHRLTKPHVIKVMVTLTRTIYPRPQLY